MNRLGKALALGLLTSLSGLLISLTPFGAILEENLGLDRLFTLRGLRAAPPEVVLITLDKESSDVFGLPNQPSKWPRSYHARLIDNLTQQGARVIAFDLLFEEPRRAADDQRLAQAMRNSRNVVLVEALKRENISLPQSLTATSQPITLERLVPPLPLFAENALATVPFPLPKVPVKVSRFWTFKPGAGDAPTLPTTVLQAYAMPAYDEFRSLLIQANPNYAAHLLPTDETILREPLRNHGLQRLMENIRGLFNQDPALHERMLSLLATSSSPNVHIIRALVNMYAGINHPYLNLYGPPHTITTLPYHRALSSTENFKDKAVFVGFSEQRQPEQKDGFYTVFSQDDSGLDISGVEIAATAFANLLESSVIRPASPPQHLALILVWGLLLGMVCRLLPVVMALLTSVALVGGYFAFSLYEFTTAALWLPVTVPLLTQAPIALLGALLWRHIDTIQLRKVIDYYVPRSVIDEMATRNVPPGAIGKLVQGVCMCTDAEEYVGLAEKLPPDQLHTLLNAYYHVLFTCVDQQGGWVSDVIGDSMLALWAMPLIAEGRSPSSHQSLHYQACHAALDIDVAVKQFNKNSTWPPLPTRIGLHSGQVMLGNVGGNVGGVGRFEYRAVGDTVNTATRIQTLNKQLGTKVLASHDALMYTHGFLTRELGSFVLKGRTQPIIIHELMCHEHDATALQHNICRLFANALADFKDQKWMEAMQGFSSILDIHATDGPTQYYLGLCDSKKNM